MIVSCPICRNGQQVGATGVKPCTLCLGSSQVDLDHICGCGKPGLKESNGKFYCGNEVCLHKLASTPKPLEHHNKRSWWDWRDRR